MLNALIRSAKPQPPSAFPPSLPNHITRTRPAGIRFSKAASGPEQPEVMDPKKRGDQESESGDGMSSFGEAYATRSDEEGFGGIYGGNQYVAKDGEDNKSHGDTVGTVNNEGSEVKEEEKGRNQKKVAG